MPRPSPVSNAQVRDFWEENPVAAASIPVPPGDPDYFRYFDALRERFDCEPYWLSNVIHDYDHGQGKRVLDVGCGNGYVLAQYARHGAHVHGIDLTEAALRLSRQRFELAGLDGDFQLTDGESIPHADASFDIVCAMGVLHHVADPRPMVAEMLRVLKPGGQVIMMLYHRYSWRNLVIIPLLALLHPKYRGRSLQGVRNATDGLDCPLAKVYSRRQARELLHDFEGHRFQVNQLAWRDLFARSPLTRWLERVHPDLTSSFLARWLGWNLYITASKPLLPRP